MAKLRKMLSDWDAPHIQALVAAMEGQSKKTLVNWAVDYCERALLPLWRADFPGDARPERAIDAARAWLAGEIKLPAAKAEILACHDAARGAEGHPAAQGAARAIGQSAAAIHSARHAIGLALYGAVALGYAALGIDAPWKEIERYAAGECARMLDALAAVSVESEPNPAKISWVC